MDESRVLKIRYKSATRRRVIETQFHPYGLVFFGMDLYCIGYLEEYEEIRTLKVLRFQGVEMTGQRFERPPSFSLAAYTRGSFGVFAPGKEQTIKVRFTGWAATNVREHTWHPSQKILRDCTGETGGEDCVIASFELSDATEFKRWLLGFGRHAVVQSPKAMADDIKAEYKAGCGAYGIRCNV